MPKIKPIKAFDKSECKRLGEEVDKYLEQIGKKFSIVLKRKAGSFVPTNFTMKIEAFVMNENGEAMTKEAETFKQMATLYGLKQTDLNRTFFDQGHDYKVIGILPRSRQPILVEREDGQLYKYSEEVVKHNLEHAGSDLVEECP